MKIIFSTILILIAGSSVSFGEENSVTPKLETETQIDSGLKSDQIRSKYSASSSSYAKPTYSAPSYSYAKPAYSAPASSYSYAKPAYSAPASSYSYAKPTYSAPASSYNYAKPTYSASSYSYSAPAYSAPSYSYSAPASSYNYAKPTYSAPASSYSYAKPAYSAPSYSYSAPAYSAPSYSYSSPASSYSYAKPAYSAPSYSYSSSAYSAPASSYAAPAPAKISYAAPATVYAPKPIYPEPKNNYRPKPIVIPLPAPILPSKSPSKFSDSFGKIGGIGIGLGLAGLASLLIRPVTRPVGFGSCRPLGLLRARQIQLMDALKTTKRSCLDGGNLNKNYDEDILPINEFDSYREDFSNINDNDNGMEILGRFSWPEINDPIVMSLLDPMAGVDLNENKRSDLCMNSRIVKGSLRILTRILKFLFKSRLCPSLRQVQSFIQKTNHKEKRSINQNEELNEQIYNFRQYNENLLNRFGEMFGPNSNLFRFGPDDLPLYQPLQSLDDYEQYPALDAYPKNYNPTPVILSPQQYPTVKPEKYYHNKPVVVVQPVTAPSQNYGKCKSAGYLKARQSQLSDTMKILKRSSSAACFLNNKVDDSDKRRSTSSLSERMAELSLLDPFSKVELIPETGKRAETCGNPRIILKTLSKIRKLVRYLFTSDDCPPIQHLTTWIMKKLDDTELIDRIGHKQLQ